MRGFALEDVSMVVPIAVALILFFSAFTWAINQTSGVDRRINLSLSMVSVADGFAQWGVLTDDLFKQSCDLLKSQERDVHFFVCLTSPSGVKDVLRNISPKGNLQDACTSTLSCASSDQLVKPFLVRYFPVIYQETLSGGDVVINDVNFLVVVVWPRV